MIVNANKGLLPNERLKGGLIYSRAVIVKSRNTRYFANLSSVTVSPFLVNFNPPASII